MPEQTNNSGGQRRRRQQPVDNTYAHVQPRPNKQTIAEDSVVADNSQ